MTVRSTLDPTLPVQYAALACQLTASAQRAVKELDLAGLAETAAAGMPGLASVPLPLKRDALLYHAQLARIWCDCEVDSSVCR